MKFPRFDSLFSGMADPWKIVLPARWQFAILLCGITAGAVFLALPPVRSAGFDLLARESGFQVTVLAALLTAALCAPPFGFPAEKLGVRGLGGGDWRVVLSGISAIYLFQLLTMPLWGALLRSCGIDFKESQAPLELCASATTLRFCGMVLIFGGVIPVTEELVFRRFLFGILRPLGMWPALVVTSLLFSLLHNFLYGFLSLWMMGAVFQWIYLRTGNLAASVAAHMLINIIALVTVFFCGV